MSSKRGSNVFVKLEEDDNGSTKVLGQQQEPRPRWHPGYKSRFPWVGASALGTVLVCAALIVVVLKTSNKKSQEDWPAYQHWHWVNKTWKQKLQLTPSVALAVLNTVSSIALTVAVTQGVTIAWWRKLLKGASVRDLHESWAYNDSFLGLIFCWRNFNLIALAALATKVAVVDNLLLQKASSSVTGIYKASVDLQVPTATHLPKGYCGEVNNDGSVSLLSSEFSTVLYQYAGSGGNIEELVQKNWDTKCTGICRTSLIAAGFSLHCVESRPEIEFTGATLKTSSAPSPGTAASTLFSTKFGIKYHDESTDYSHITFDSIYAGYRQIPGSPDGSEMSCNGEQYVNTCELRPAIVEYPIVIDNNLKEIHSQKGVRIGGDGLDYTNRFLLRDQIQLEGIRVISEQNSIETLLPGNGTTLGGIHLALSNMFQTEIELGHDNRTGWSVSPATSGMGSWWIGYTYATTSDGQISNPVGNWCGYGLNDPTSYILAQLNEWMLRLALKAAWTVQEPPGSDESDTFLPSIITVKQADIANLTGIQTTDTLIYESVWGFMAGALASMLLCVVCTLPTFYGYWELGRPVTLGPVEIASAFQAPLLDHSVASNGNMHALLYEVGGRRVQYGEIASTGKLAVAEPHLIHQLQPAHNNDIHLKSWGGGL